MNDTHKAVLVTHGPDINNALMVTEALLGSMYHKKIFEEEMINMIRVCQLPSDKVYKLLELLPKRGPDAFDSFVEILEEQYDWLAKSMKEYVVIENEKLAALQVQTQATIAEIQIPRTTSSQVHLDSDIKSRASAFVQTQFGNVRNISMSDKKAVERWIGEWLHNERKRLNEAFEIATSNVFENPQIKDRLLDLYRELCSKQQKPCRKRQPQPSNEAQRNDDNNNGNGTDDTAMKTENLIDIVAEDMSFNLIQEKITEITGRLVYMETQINTCYQYMGFSKTHNKEVSHVVHDLCGAYRHREEELNKVNKKNVEMLEDLYQFSSSKSRMQITIDSQELQARTLQDEIADVRCENDNLLEKIKKLERQNEVHLEKEQTLSDLKKVQEGLQATLDKVNKQNDELKKKVKDTKGASSRLYQNKKTIPPNKFMKTVVPKQTFPKKK